LLEELERLAYQYSNVQDKTRVMHTHTRKIQSASPSDSSATLRCGLSWQIVSLPQGYGRQPTPLP